FSLPRGRSGFRGRFCLVIATVDQLDVALAERLRFGKLEVRLTRFVEETLSAAEYDRIDEQTILIDQVVRQERSDEGRTPVDDDVAARLLLELRDFRCQVAFDEV